MKTVIWKKKKKGCCSDEDIDNLIDEKLNENEADESESENMEISDGLETINEDETADTDEDADADSDENL